MNCKPKTKSKQVNVSSKVLTHNPSKTKNCWTKGWGFSFSDPLWSDPNSCWIWRSPLIWIFWSSLTLFYVYSFFSGAWVVFLWILLVCIGFAPIFFALLNTSFCLSKKKNNCSSLSQEISLTMPHLCTQSILMFKEAIPSIIFLVIWSYI